VQAVTPYYRDEYVTLYHGDCRDVLPALEPESVTLLWTDPPYGHGNHDGDHKRCGRSPSCSANKDGTNDRRH
jgi:DNA modification methylase